MAVSVLKGAHPGSPHKNNRCTHPRKVQEFRSPRSDTGVKHPLLAQKVLPTLSSLRTLKGFQAFRARNWGRKPSSCSDMASCVLPASRWLWKSVVLSLGAGILAPFCGLLGVTTDSAAVS